MLGDFSLKLVGASNWTTLTKSITKLGLVKQKVKHHEGYKSESLSFTQLS